jgi:hypothetical protein
MGEQLEPFLEDSTIPPLSTAHLEMIHEAGSRAPYRHWGSTWPYYVSFVLPVSSVLISDARGTRVPGLSSRLDPPSDARIPERASEVTLEL